MLIDPKQILGGRKTGEMLLVPAIGFQTQGTHVMQTTYDGSAMLCASDIQASRVLFRVTASLLAANFRVLVYQAADGSDALSAAALVKLASVTVAAPVAGAQTFLATWEQVPAPIFRRGYLYVLYARTGVGTGTMRTTTNNTIDLLNANLNAATPPVTFTTAISAAAADPASINPLTQLTAATVDVAPVMKLLQ